MPQEKLALSSQVLRKRQLRKTENFQMITSLLQAKTTPKKVQPHPRAKDEWVASTLMLASLQQGTQTSCQDATRENRGRGPDFHPGRRVVAAPTQRPHGEPGLLPRLSSNEASLAIPRRVALKESYCRARTSTLLLLISNIATSTKYSKDHMESISEVLLSSRVVSLPLSGNKDPFSSLPQGTLTSHWQ